MPQMKEYTFQFSQEGTLDPSVSIYKNTLGGTVIWTRTGIGNYVGTLVGAFPIAKTICLPFGDAAGGASLIPISIGNPKKGYYQIRVDVGGDAIVLSSMSDLDYTTVEWSDIGGNITARIEVYP